MLHLTHAPIPVNERPVKGQPVRREVDERFFEAWYGDGRAIMTTCPLKSCLLAVRAAAGEPVPDLVME